MGNFCSLKPKLVRVNMGRFNSMISRHQSVICLLSITVFQLFAILFMNLFKLYLVDFAGLLKA